MADELISKTSALNYLERRCEVTCCQRDCDFCDLDYAKSTIKSLEGIKIGHRAHWCFNDYERNGDKIYMKECSSCNNHLMSINTQLPDYLYCPFCGARMDEYDKNRRC